MFIIVTGVDYNTYISERILLVRLEINKGHHCVIRVYAPEEGKDEDIFYEQFQKVLNKYSELLVGNVSTPSVFRNYEKNCVNSNSHKLTDLTSFNAFKITNTFKKK